MQLMELVAFTIIRACHCTIKAHLSSRLMTSSKSYSSPFSKITVLDQKLHSEKTSCTDLFLQLKMDLITYNLYIFLWNWASLSVPWKRVKIENIFKWKRTPFSSNTSEYAEHISYLLPAPNSYSYLKTQPRCTSSGKPCLNLKAPKCSQDSCCA